MGGHRYSRPVALPGSCDEISHRRLFPQSRQCNRPSLSFRASLSESPYKRSAHRPLPWSLCDKPERTAQPRLLVREGAAHAGRPGPRACPIQRALAGHLEKRTRGPRACQCCGPPLEGGNGPIRASRQRTGRPSQRRLGADSRAPRIVRHSPGGGAQAGGAARPSSESGPVAVDAPLREMHADPRVHCALS